MLFNSIQSLATKEIENLKKTNPTLRRYSLSLLPLWISKASTHPIYYALWIFLVGVLLLEFWFLIGTKNYIDQSIFNLEFSPRLDFQNHLLVLQAAIAALTFPILIGFVGSLPQGGDLQKTKLPTYLLFSGAPFVGISSISLILFMSIQLSFQSFLPYGVKQP